MQEVSVHTSKDGDGIGRSCCRFEVVVELILKAKSSSSISDVRQGIFEDLI